jgi:hypothetical protein
VKLATEDDVRRALNALLDIAEDHANYTAEERIAAAGQILSAAWTLDQPVVQEAVPPAG